MGTSTSFKELAGKLDLVATNIEAARRASFRQAERDMAPMFNRQARAAGGSDQRPRNARGRMTAQFRVEDSGTESRLYINPTGPWGIRDNTDIGTPTGDHIIRPRKVKRLSWIGEDGTPIFARKVSHPGSSRGPFWGTAREDAMERIRRRIPEDVQNAIESALSGSGFKSRA